MFESWKQAWKDAVENFRRELDPERYLAEAGRKAAAMRRELADARALARRLEREIEETRRSLTLERNEVERCRRRESMARQIGDLETADIAAEYASRHAERAAVLQQKLDALTAEHALSQRDLQAMQAALADLGPTEAPPYSEHLDNYDDDFRRLEHEARERAAEARLEELKRKMR